jgi:sulfur dioxygenase
MTSDWPPLSHPAAGVPEIAPDWVAANAGAVQILDVREPAEFDGPLGHIPGAVLIPLGQLPERVFELSPARPLVAVCRSGARSAQATLFLQSAGFERVANLPGGMLRWRAEGRAVEGGSS